MLGRKPPASWSDLVVAPGGLGTPDIVVDPDPDDAGIVVTAGESIRPGITHASLEGLAKALRVRIDQPSAEVVWTSRGKPRREGPVHHFPPPLGAVRGIDGDAPVEGDLAGVGVFGVTSLVVVDDRRFLETICMAAGAVVADIAIEGPIPVWERADAYLAACEELGVVIAEAVTS